MSEDVPVRSRWRADLAAYGCFLLASLYVFGHLWADVQHRRLGLNPGDQAFAEWMYADQARTLGHLGNPFFTHGQNAPLGINLMGNVATQLVSWIMAPVTWLFGPAVTFALVSTLNLAGTAAAWYHVLSRHVVRSRWAAFGGALFCGFSPGMISESNAHVHIPAQYLVPFIVLAAFGAGSWWKRGLLLGVLISAQLLIGAEVLFLTAFACGLLVLAFAASRWREAKDRLLPSLARLGVAGAVVLVLCAYPLWMLFFGPRHYHGIVVVYSADLTSLVSYPYQSLGGLTAGKSYAIDLAEEAAYFGWPLAIAAVGVAVLLWRHQLARVVALTGGVCAVLSLGPKLYWKGHDTGIPGPYRLLSGLPVFDSLITLRLALITAVAIGVLLAIGLDWVVEHAPAAHVPLRALAAVVGLAVFVPLVPKPLPAVHALPVPRFITSGRWSQYVREDRTLVPVDAGVFGNLRWGVAGGARFAVPRGFTLVPRNPPKDLTGVFNVPMLPIEIRLDELAGGLPRDVGPAEQRQAADDLRYLRADAVVMEATDKHDAAVPAISTLLGRPAQHVDDVYVWSLT